MLNKVKRNVLVAPLDWGLGHATRCIPLIRELLNAGFEVFIAAEGKIKILLLREFPYLTFLPLKGYHIEYSKTRIGLFLKIFFQVPKLLTTIRNENRWLHQIVEQQNIDLVISDNRYGLYSELVPCIFMTHQLKIQAPVFSRALQRVNYRYINRFTECWVPDDESEPGLAGRLSHPAKKPLIPLKYIGTLSRFSFEITEEKHLLVLLSGPEPQRTLLENILIEELKDYTLPVVFVRGLPEQKEQLSLGSNVIVANHLESKQLEEAMRKSWMVIARSGYSTVMDIMKLQKKSILIPTPGQTEQEYLAKHLSACGYAYSVEQKEFSLHQSLTKTKVFPYKWYSSDGSQLRRAIFELKDILK